MCGGRERSVEDLFVDEDAAAIREAGMFRGSFKLLSFEVKGQIMMVSDGKTCCQIWRRIMVRCANGIGANRGGDTLRSGHVGGSKTRSRRLMRRC